MASIKLLSREGNVVGTALVDDGDFEALSHHKWYAQKAVSTTYAVRTSAGRPVMMHHDIIGRPAEGFVVDHINRNGLDNRRINLRRATHSENMQNRAVHKNSRSGARGVCWDPTHKQWRANVKSGGKRIYSARFHSLATAIEAARAARLRLLPFAVD